MVVVRTYSAQLNSKLRNLSRRYRPAAVTGINRTAQGAMTLAVREIQANLQASTQKTIRRNLSLSRATDARPQAQIISSSKKNERIPIFELRPTPRIVSRRRPRGGIRYGPQRKLIPGSFIARLRSGHIGVFKRIGAFGRSGNPKLEKIAELFGPSIALVFSRRAINQKIKALIAERLPREIARALRFAA